MNRLQFLYKNQAVIQRGDYFLLDKNTAIQFLMDCKKENIQVLGIDGFYKVTENAVQPSMANSIDFSASSYKGDRDSIYEYGIQFIHSRENDLYFEIICES